MLALGGHHRVQAPPPLSAPVGAEFKCSVCGRSFSSYQALGGHKTSHRFKLPTPPASPVLAPASSEPAAATTVSRRRLRSRRWCGRRQVRSSSAPSAASLSGAWRPQDEPPGQAADSARSSGNGHSAARAFDLNLPAGAIRDR
ncbi:Os08g0300366 [Oryza sativa Japonica Group]|uniref:Os08g0300366 protein n=1 Tax=Oryza sativa subsp. japonica TaxID=39947 RepID=A0A0P0XER8_ORYSJ|nr:hypothetical protein EE612_043395 [Oryza sativa]BAT04808.1 Os08g0300366 [Oryza sativa Japonica Group]